MDNHLTQEQLRERLTAALQQVTVGARYMHYKQLTYIVKDVALIEADNEPAVIYQAEYGERITFIRPLADWLATVDVDGKSQPRFIKVG
jgi:hypothetical protein